MIKRKKDNLTTIRSDIKRSENRFDKMEKRMVAKEDLKMFATKEDWKLFATKDDLMKFKSEIINHIDAFVGLYKKYDQELSFSVHRFNTLETRVTRLEEKVFA